MLDTTKIYSPNLDSKLMTYSYNLFNSSTWSRQHVQSKTIDLIKTSSFPVFPSPSMASPSTQLLRLNPRCHLGFLPPTYGSNAIWVVLVPPRNCIPDCLHLSSSTEAGTSNYPIRPKNSKHFHLAWKFNYCPLLSLHLASINRSCVLTTHM